MTQLLFRNRWFALFWALSICFTIASFFGKGGGQEQLAQAATDIRHKRVEAARTESAIQQDLEESQVIRGRPVSTDEPLPGEPLPPVEQSGESEAY